jgi:DNA-binding LytR/AlgR family response regulator
MTHTKINCLIVDDEPIGREIVEDYVARTAGLEAVASCEDAFEAIDILQHQHIDILFSDIQMPKVNGLELVKSLPQPPVVIFITGYREFAVDSYELNIIDYLLKPVPYERFLKAVNKAVLYIEALRQKNQSAAAATEAPYIFVRTDNNKMSRVLFADIRYVEALKDYVKIHTSEKPLVVYSTMKAMEEKLPAGKFCRIHQSYLVPLEQIKNLAGNT